MSEAVLPPKIRRVHEKLSKIQQTDKPMLSFTRNTSWNHEPCDWCGDSEKLRAVGGRYVAGYVEDNTLLRVCGNCEKKMEQFFEMIYI